VGLLDDLLYSHFLLENAKRCGIRNSCPGEADSSPCRSPRAEGPEVESPKVESTGGHVHEMDNSNASPREVNSLGRSPELFIWTVTFGG